LTQWFHMCIITLRCLDGDFITGICVDGKRSSPFSSKDGYVETFLRGSTLRTLVKLISVMLAVISIRNLVSNGVLKGLFCFPFSSLQSAMEKLHNWFW
jgi:hypothetical protein